MSTIKQSQQLGIQGLAAQTWHGAISIAADLGRAVAGGLACLGLERAGVSTVAYADASARERAARLFDQALCENSIFEMDWLWYAANMTDDTRRRYCFERALTINPGSELAERALAKLARG